jgi:LETM1 and EF-hand domain-containing protein 1
LKQLTQKAPPKVADTVSDRVEKMIKKIDAELKKYDSEIGSRLNLIRPDEEGRMSVSDLEEVLKVIRDNPGDERMKKIVKRLDSDGDGVISIPEVLAMIQDMAEKEGHGVVMPPMTPSVATPGAAAAGVASTAPTPGSESGSSPAGSSLPPPSSTSPPTPPVA